MPVRFGDVQGSLATCIAHEGIGFGNEQNLPQYVVSSSRSRGAGITGYKMSPYESIACVRLLLMLCLILVMLLLLLSPMVLLTLFLLLLRLLLQWLALRWLAFCGCFRSPIPWKGRASAFVWVLL